MVAQFTVLFQNRKTKKFHTFFYQIQLSFVDLRWAQLYVSLVFYWSVSRCLVFGEPKTCFSLVYYASLPPKTFKYARTNEPTPNFFYAAYHYHYHNSALLHIITSTRDVQKVIYFIIYICSWKQLAKSLEVKSYQYLKAVKSTAWSNIVDIQLMMS